LKIEALHEGQGFESDAMAFKDSRISGLHECPAAKISLQSLQISDLHVPHE
jgi:hypothetical protein